MNDFAGKIRDDLKLSQEHPPREHLLLYVDGELTEKEGSQMKAHLEVCWNCRGRVARIEETIAEFSAFDESALTPRLPPPPNEWRGFESRLKARVAENGRRPLISRLRGLIDWWTLGFVRTRLAVGVATLLVLSIAGVWFLRAPTVSAGELLRRSIQTEAGALSRVPEPVLYRRLQVQRKSARGVQSLAWENWRSVKDRQFRQRVADQEGGTRFIAPAAKPASPLISELEEIFRANQLDLHRALSASAYAEWRGRIRVKSEIVTKVALPGLPGAEALSLTTTPESSNAKHSILEASLVVRRSDWRAVSQRFKVHEEDGVCDYELSETAYEVLPLQAITVFADLTPALEPGPTEAGKFTPSNPPPSASPSPGPTETELENAEIAALYQLHLLRADLGEQIEVLRKNGRQIIVRGVVEEADRKRQLMEAVRLIPLVVTQIQTVEEAASLASPAAQPGAEPSGQENQPASVSGASPFQQRLERYFMEQASDRRNAGRQSAQLSNAAVSQSSALLAEAWAMRRLAERFAKEKRDDWQTGARARLNEMMNNHLARLKSQTGALRSRLQPAMIAIAGDGSTEPRSVASDPDQIMAVFRAAQRIDGLINGLFAGSDRTEEPEQAARRVLRALDDLDLALHKVGKTD